MSQYLLAALAGIGTREQLLQSLKDAMMMNVELGEKLAVYADPVNWGADSRAWVGSEFNGWDIAQSVEPLRVFDPVRDIAEFHTKFHLEYDGKPRLLPAALSEFRVKFMAEEIEEYAESARADCDTPEEHARELALQLDALVDEVYVVLGTAYLHGFNFREAWRRVHAANMAKVRAERASDSKRGSTFDVIKPPGWVAPDHSDLVADHAHKE